MVPVGRRIGRRPRRRRRNVPGGRRLGFGHPPVRDDRFVGLDGRRRSAPAVVVSQRRRLELLHQFVDAAAAEAVDAFDDAPAAALADAGALLGVPRHHRTGLLGGGRRAPIVVHGGV